MQHHDRGACSCSRKLLLQTGACRSLDQPIFVGAVVRTTKSRLLIIGDLGADERNDESSERRLVKNLG